MVKTISRLILSTFAVLVFIGAVRAEDELFQQSDVNALLECLNATVRKVQDGARASKRDCIGVAAQTCERRDGGGTTRGIALCAHGEMEWWDGQLNAVYKRLRHRLPEQHFIALRQVQQKWIAYKEARCKLAYDIWEGGSIRIPSAAWCNLEVTATRALELEEMLTAGPFI